MLAKRAAEAPHEGEVPMREITGEDDAYLGWDMAAPSCDRGS